MPFPIAIVGFVGGAAAVGVVGGIIANWDDHSDYSDYSRYSDAEERREREREAREKERRKNLRVAKKEMDNTLIQVRAALANQAGREGSRFFDDWHLSAEDFSYRDFTEEYSKLDSEAQKRIAQATSTIFDEEELERQKELDEINAVLRRIAEKRIAGE